MYYYSCMKSHFTFATTSRKIRARTSLSPILNALKKTKTHWEKALRVETRLARGFGPYFSSELEKMCTSRDSWVSFFATQPLAAWQSSSSLGRWQITCSLVKLHKIRNNLHSSKSRTPKPMHFKKPKRPSKTWHFAIISSPKKETNVFSFSSFIIIRPISPVNNPPTLEDQSSYLAVWFHYTLRLC